MTAIRKASLEDLQLVVEVFDQYRIFYEKESDKEKAREFIHERLTFNDSRIYVAESNDKNIIRLCTIIPHFFIHKNATTVAIKRFVCRQRI